jgi:hypothetical protein
MRIRNGSRALVAAVALLAAAAPAHAGNNPTVAVTQAATAIADSGATLQGQVTPQSPSTSFYFDYGLTTAYGTQTMVTYVAQPAQLQTVQAKLTGLKAGTLYHFRVVAGEGTLVSFGADMVFKTTGGSTPPPTGTSTSGSLPNPLAGLTGPGVDPLGGLTTPNPSGDGTTTTIQPVLGQSVGAGPAAGSVLVQVPGAPGFAPLGANAPLPVGTTVDARQGTVNVVTALGSSGQIQGAQFRGAIFQVRQNPAAGGLTDIVLRGGDFGVCRTAAPRRARNAVGAARARTVRRLWGRDHGGRFRTRGSHAIATVRGTEWVVADRCDGTLTKVADGAVSVRDRDRRRTVLVTAGHSYLARAQTR